jgi:hypothetical protein
MRQRLDEVDPEGPFGPKEFVSVLLKKWESE